MRLWWCKSCGMVWTADFPPICKHNVPDGPPARGMAPLPRYHPMHPDFTEERPSTEPERSG